MGGFDGVSGTWWAFLIAVVVFGEGKRRGLGKGLSSYQLFRGVMDYLGEWCFAFDRVVVCTR